MPTKQRAKYKVPWETLALRKKRADVKTTFKFNRKNPTNKKAQNELDNISLKEQTEYMQNQIDKTRDSVEDRQSSLTWKTINEVSRKKSIAKSKLKGTSQKERIQLWKQHFGNLYGKPPKVTHEPTTRIIRKQLDIKIEQFTQEELNSVLKKIKIGKQESLMKYPQKYGKPGYSKTYYSDTLMLL